MGDHRSRRCVSRFRSYRAKAQALLAKDAVYLPVYRALLEFAAECPRDKSAIDAVIDPHPLVQNPRLFAGYFLGELERIDAMGVGRCLACHGARSRLAGSAARWRRRRKAALPRRRHMIDEGMRAWPRRSGSRVRRTGSWRVCCAPRWMTRLSGGCAREVSCRERQRSSRCGLSRVVRLSERRRRAPARAIWPWTSCIRSSA